MVHSVVNGLTPTHEPISKRQNSSESLELIRAYSYYYKWSKRTHFVRLLGMLVLAILAPVILFWHKDWADVVGAIAGLWVLAGRTILSWIEDHFILKGVTVQEQFDVELFDLDWNDALAGSKAELEDIHGAAKKNTNKGLKNWYPDVVDQAPWPLNVIICQRSSAVWGRRDHFVYAYFVLGLGAAWFIAGLVMFAAAHVTLADYLIIVFLPSQPAFLDTIDLYRGHLAQSKARVGVP